MKKPHIHAELIKAWADGAQIQWYDKLRRDWETIDTPAWQEDGLYRVKPEPKADIVLYRHVGLDVFPGIGHEQGILAVGTWPEKQTNIRLIFDGETGKLKAAEVLP